MKLVAPVAFLTSDPKRPAPADAPVPVPVAELDAFGHELLERLGGNPQPYRLNAAILHFSLRFLELARVTPKRDAAKLAAVYARHGNALYDRWLALSRVEFSKPPKPEAGVPPAEEPPRQPTTFELLSELYRTF